MNHAGAAIDGARSACRRSRWSVIESGLRRVVVIRVVQQFMDRRANPGAPINSEGREGRHPGVGVFLRFRIILEKDLRPAAVALEVGFRPDIKAAQVGHALHLLRAFPQMPVDRNEQLSGALRAAKSQRAGSSLGQNFFRFCPKNKHRWPNERPPMFENRTSEIAGAATLRLNELRCADGDGGCPNQPHQVHRRQPTTRSKVLGQEQW